MMNPNSRGFTLIELMIAMAVLAGLAAIAIPSYQNYIIRTEVSESLLTMAQHGKKMINYYNKHGEWPENGDSGPLSLSSFNKDYVEYGAGSHQQIAGSANVWMTYNKYGKRIAAFMQPEIANGQVTWHCGPSVYTKRDKTSIYLPDTCQEDTLTFVY